MTYGEVAQRLLELWVSEQDEDLGLGVKLREHGDRPWETTAFVYQRFDPPLHGRFSVLYIAVLIGQVPKYKSTNIKRKDLEMMYDLVGIEGVWRTICEHGSVEFYEPNMGRILSRSSW